MHTARLARIAVLALGLLLSRGALAQDARQPASVLDGVTLDVEVDSTQLVETDKLLALWGKKLGVSMHCDPQMTGYRVHLANGPLTWGEFKKILDFQDIVIDQKNLPGVTVLFAHLRRNIPSKNGPPYPTVPAEQAALHPDEIVTTIIPIQSGSGSDIFATVRGLLVRDVNRIGNILYVRGSESIILVDFGANVDYYARVIRALDVPGVVTRVLDLEHANAEDAARTLELLAGDGTKAIAAPRTNQLVVRGPSAEVGRLADLVTKIDVPSGSSRPRFHSETGVALWKIATAFAAVAFVGQTILLRRFQRRALLTKLSV